LAATGGLAALVAAAAGGEEQGRSGRSGDDHGVLPVPHGVFRPSVVSDLVVRWCGAAPCSVEEGSSLGWAAVPCLVMRRAVRRGSRSGCLIHSGRGARATTVATSC